MTQSTILGSQNSCANNEMNHEMAKPDMTSFEQEELICSVLSQHLLRQTQDGIPDIKPIWLDT